MSSKSVRCHPLVNRNTRVPLKVWFIQLLDTSYSTSVDVFLCWDEVLFVLTELSAMLLG